MVSVLSAFQRFSDPNGQRVAMRQGDVVYYIHTDHPSVTPLISPTVGLRTGPTAPTPTLSLPLAQSVLQYAGAREPMGRLTAPPWTRRCNAHENHTKPPRPAGG